MFIRNNIYHAYKLIRTCDNIGKRFLKIKYFQKKYSAVKRLQNGVNYAMQVFNFSKYIFPTLLLLLTYIYNKFSNKHYVKM